MKTPELEAKYQVFAIELRRIKNGDYGHNIFYFVLRTYLRVSLELRLIRLNKDFEYGRINKAQYMYYKEIIHL